MNDICELLVYFDSKKILNDMKLACEDFIECLTEKTILQYPPIRYILNLDFIKFFEEHPDLGQMLLQEPRKFKKLSGTILYSCLKSLCGDELQTELMPAQVHLIVRVNNLPNMKISSTKHYYNGLTSIVGILLTKSKPSAYTYQSVWSCPEECETIVLQNLPKSTPKCIVCKSILYEHSGYRRTAEKVVATFKIDGNRDSVVYPLLDDLALNLKLGARYTLAIETYIKTLVVWSVQEIIPITAPITHSIPKDIQNLYDKCKTVPWKFIYCLASGLGLQICPVSSLLHLKISLLLSLTSVQANASIGAPIVHVLATGLDSSHVSKLMIETASLSNRYVTVSPTNNTQISTALIASSGGICAMALPIQNYPQKQTSAILSAIERSEIITDDGIVTLRSAIWAQGSEFHKISMFKVASVFGSVCRGDLGEDNDEVIEFILENAIEFPRTTKRELRAIEDLKTYIDIVAGIDVSLDEDAEELLRNYFLGARREWPEGVLIGTMSALIATSMTSARLCRRATVNIDDAIFAIWLHVSGNPGPRFAPDEYLETPADVRKLHKMMDNFRKWLEERIVGVRNISESFDK